MKKNQLIISMLLMIFFACKENSNNKSNLKIDTLKSAEIVTSIQKDTFENRQTENLRRDTLFLGFSPNMTETEFKNQKIKENQKRLTNSKFDISLNNQVLNFNIIQHNEAIELYYSSQLFSRNDLRTNFHLRLFNELFYIFNSKYTYHNYADFPNNLSYNDFTKTYIYDNPEKNNDNSLLKPLTEYGFHENNYSVFNDSLKTIIIGFSTRKDQIAEMLSVSGVSGFKNEYDSNQVKRKKIEYDDMNMYVYNFSIIYFFNKDFNNIKNVIERDYFKVMDSLKLNTEEKERYLKRVKKNNSEL